MEQGSERETKKYRGGGRVSFLAHLESFKLELNQGWPMRAVYDRHSEKLNMSYMQFSRYVHKYITGPVSESSAPVKEKDQPIVVATPAVNLASSPSRLNDASQLDDSELF